MFDDGNDDPEDDKLVSDDNYNVTFAPDGKSFEIVFDENYLKSLAGATVNRKIKITYTATITEDAVTQVGENEVTIDYERGDTSTTEYTYTVSFDGIAKKIGAGPDAEGLDGAIFTLYDTWNDKNADGRVSADEISGEVKTAETAAPDYTVDFSGLDADKIYYFTETAAPDGYTVNSKVYTIEFKNLQRNEADGSITYEVWVDGALEATVVYGNTVSEPAMVIENTKLPSLPPPVASVLRSSPSAAALS